LTQLFRRWCRICGASVSSHSLGVHPQRLGDRAVAGLGLEAAAKERQGERTDKLVGKLPTGSKRRPSIAAGERGKEGGRGKKKTLVPMAPRLIERRGPQTRSPRQPARRQKRSPRRRPSLPPQSAMGPYRAVRLEQRPWPHASVTGSRATRFKRPAATFEISF
jgi:hypothetical protein